MAEMNEAARGGRGPGQDATVGELARQLPEQISRLVREELRLAQLEMTQKGKRAGIGAGMLGGGGVIALYGVAAVLAAAILALTLPVAAATRPPLPGQPRYAFCASCSGRCR